MTEHGGDPIDVAHLLTIDVAAELRKLTQAQLQGSWQLPAELVRRALRDSARRVEVHLHRESISVEDDGRGLTVAVLEQLATLLDEAGEPARRHAALIGLERAGGLALIAMAGMESRRLRVVTSTSQGPKLLEYRRGVGPPSIRDFAPPAPDGTRFVLDGARIDRGRARGWLENVCRFAGADVIVDGHAVPRGFVGSLARRALTAPFVGEISIPREGDGARAWLLQDGIVSTHVTLAPAPCFEAVVEMRTIAGADATPASLREAIERHLDALIGQAIAHMIALGKHADTLPAAIRQRVTPLLLEAARQRRYAADVARLPLFRGYEEDADGDLDSAWFDLVTVRAAVEQHAGERTLVALFPDQDPSHYALGSRAFVLDEAERALLGELLGLRFRPPRQREELGIWGRLTKATFRRVANLGDTVAGAIWRKRPVPESELSASERRFAQVIQLALGGQRTAGTVFRELVLCEGAGPVRRTGGVVWLPRANEVVVACVEAVARDPSWSYPALLCLLGGRALPSAHARFIWTQARARG